MISIKQSENPTTYHVENAKCHCGVINTKKNINYGKETKLSLTFILTSFSNVEYQHLCKASPFGQFNEGFGIYFISNM